MNNRLLVWLLVWGIFAMAIVGGCSPQDRDREAVREVEQAAPPGDSADTSRNVLTVRDSDTTWTVGVREKTGSRVATLMEVRTASHDAYDRIVFEFTGAMPGYRIEYVDRPVRQCGSGEAVALPGDAWLSLRFYPANAHTEEGHPTVLERDREWSDPKTNLKALKLICDFEAVTEWVAGVGHAGEYRVLELTGPDRIAVDMRKRR